jgi:hypothetical protein
MAYEQRPTLRLACRRARTGQASQEAGMNVLVVSDHSSQADNTPPVIGGRECYRLPKGPPGIDSKEMGGGVPNPAVRLR